MNLNPQGVQATIEAELDGTMTDDCLNEGKPVVVQKLKFAAFERGDFVMD